MGWVLIMVVVAIFFFCVGNFGGEELVFVAKFCGRWLCGFTEERERKRGQGRDESELFILFNVIVYIILMSCI